jgi:hypothetical protein
MNKRGIELAANIIIILIISIIVFGLATTLTYKIFCASGSKIDQLDAATEKRIEQLLNSGAAVTIADPSKTTKQSASFCSSDQPSASFLLGIRNDLVNAPATQFEIQCEYSGAEQPDGTIVSTGAYAADCADSSSPWGYQMTQSLVTVDAGRKIPLRILFAPKKAPAGKQVFTIRVYNTNDYSVPYGVKKIYLTIE